MTDDASTPADTVTCHVAGLSTRVRILGDFFADMVAGADLGDYATWLTTLRESKSRLGEVCEALETICGEEMGQRTRVLDGFGMLSRSKRTNRTAWDREMLLRDVLDSRLVDAESGEIADEAPLDRVLHVWNLGAPRTTALRARGLDPDEYATVETRPGWTVRIET